MATQKRLILCLDGTWNQEDSSTNVLHHYNLVCAGPDPDSGLIQTKYYHPGVGTGVLDSVTGGGFGFGLEKNVRDAYNWLVLNYCDAGQEKPDEVFIFGFSRGAYTARSLVGFIGECGLLRRGAPITVSELWQAYCILGRRREKRTSVWDNLFKQPKAPIRAITTLATDPWTEAKYGPAPWLATDPNPTEKMLIHWSRRIRITYLGVYDTVGAIGWDALAIPGLVSHIAMHNNLRPTTIIQHCRHALSINENRSSFNHTPFMAYIGLGAAEPEVERGMDENPAVAEERSSPDADRRQWEKTSAMWRRKIEQRWFAGSHSNIGGGYPGNRLAELPLQWILEGAKGLKLHMESANWDPPPRASDQTPRDSFAEFAAPLWTQILRAKRHYRLMDPDPLPSACPNAGSAASPPAGFSLQSIHETVDPAVFSYWEESKLPLPPNLYDYAIRRGIKTSAAPPVHHWPGGLSDFVALVVWATLAAAGLASLCQLIGLNVLSDWHRWAAYFAACVFPFVDLSESVVNFKRASGSGSPSFMAFLDSIYWTRALGFVLFLCGLVTSIHYLGLFGWQWNTEALKVFAGFYWPLPLFAAAGTVLASKGAKQGWVSLILGPAAIFGSAAIVFGLLRLAGMLFQAPTLSRKLPPPDGLSTPGLLLVLLFALLYFCRAFRWGGEPMAEANLGSVVKLQRCFTPARVRDCLLRWHCMLECRWLAEDPIKGPAAVRMRDVAASALWRDIIGFIPVYTAFLVFGLWFGAYYSHWKLLMDFLKRPGNGLALWWLIPAVAAAADYLEDACHLTYLRLHKAGAQPALALTLFSCSMTGVKLIAFIAGLGGTFAAIAAGVLHVSGEMADWRAKFVILIASGMLLTIVVYLAGRVAHLVAKPAGKPASGVPRTNTKNAAASDR